jgi:hypothetical protein
MTLGVALSTHNRRNLFERAIAQWQRWIPPGTVLVVVDDASDVPVPEISGVMAIRHDVRMGVAMTKNRGIAALMDAGCDHLFLSDDDVHPVRDWWWRPYVQSSESHLSWQGPQHNRIVGGDDEHYAVEFPKGYLLYVHREVVDAVGGMDPAFGTWGGEHVEWQRRIHDASLTSWPYADARGTDALWRALVSRSTTRGCERKGFLSANGVQWNKPRPRFVPYREGHSVQDYSLGPEIPDDGSRSPLLSHILALKPSGTAVEFGVGAGDSARLIAKEMPLVGFDSAQGLPENWRPKYPRGSLAFPMPDIDNATMVEGWFEDTLPRFDFAAQGYIGLVHFDADLYSSTDMALKCIGPYLRPGCYVVFDEWMGYLGCEDHEQRAWREFAARSGIGWTVVGHRGETWGIRIG